MSVGAARLELVLGPVGAGKSTFAARLAHERAAVRLTLDDWMSTLFSPDRPETDVLRWYTERCERCLVQIWKVAQEILAVGTNVVLEPGLVQRGPRLAFLQRIDDAEVPLRMHVLDAPREVRRARVEQRNRERGATFSMFVPPRIFELASDAWEPPDEAECRGRDVHFIGSDSPPSR